MKDLLKGKRMVVDSNMIIDTNNTISITEANQNFSRATALADKNGEAVIYKRNKPKYLLVNIEEHPQIEMSEDEKIIFVAQRILHKHINAFKELAK